MDYFLSPHLALEPGHAKFSRSINAPTLLADLGRKGRALPVLVHPPKDRLVPVIPDLFPTSTVSFMLVD